MTDQIAYCTSRERDLLHAILEMDAPTVQQLADRLGVSKATVHWRKQRLRLDGLLCFQPGRRYGMLVTEKGQRWLFSDQRVNEQRTGDVEAS